VNSETDRKMTIVAYFNVDITAAHERERERERERGGNG
jgi:hypothetical protein